MKELPDLSRIMAARTSAKKGGSGGEAPRADQIETPMIVLSDSPSKFLKAAGLVGSSSEDSETESGTEDNGPKDQGKEGNSNPPVAQEPTTNVDAPAATFGRISGPDQSDNGGRKDSPPG
ncbi:hypothetical protein Bca4012_065235 [Brassica carinata]